MLPWFLKYPNQNDEILNLDWVLSHMQELIKDVTSLTEWRSKHEKEYDELLALYEEVKKDYDDIAAGIIPEGLLTAIHKWLEVNALDIIGEFVKFVFFGLTLDGYFVAYIPDAWDSINFDTIIVPDSPDYGKLCILY